MPTLRNTYLLLLYLVSINVYAKPQYVFQSEDPIANFAWDENDTTRYEGHYRFEYAYKLIEDMLTDKHPLDFAEAVFAVENCMKGRHPQMVVRGPVSQQVSRHCLPE